MVKGKPVILVLGAGVMQGPALRIAAEMGLEAIAADADAHAPCIPLAAGFERVDLKDREGIEALGRSLMKQGALGGIMTAGSDFSATVAWAAEKLKLPGIPYEAALDASDKSRMRACFKKAGLPSPEFVTIENTHWVDNLFPPFPLVVKPVDNMGARGCRRVNNSEEFRQAAEDALGFSRSGRAIVEEYMEGPEFSVDAIVHHGNITICGLADRHIFFPPYFIEMGHTMPTDIGEMDQLKILETFRRGIHALGLAGKNSAGAAKGDIKMTSNGPMIGEIAARLSGGFMSGWTYPYSSGVLPVKAAIQAAMGLEPDCLIQQKKWTCAERAFISIPGTVLGVRDQGLGARDKGSGAKDHGSGTGDRGLGIFVNDYFPRVSKGDKVSFPENNVTKCGNIIASAPDRESACKAAENAARSILIRLDPSDPQTEAFLFQESRIEEHRSVGNSYKFPPDAFQLNKELIDELNQLPESLRGIEASVREHQLSSKNEGSPLNGSCSSWSITPFNSFQKSNLKDYMGRTVEDTLEAVRLLTGFILPIEPKNAENNIRLGREFWTALVRGSYQGAVYYIDSLGKNERNDNRKNEVSK